MLATKVLINPAAHSRPHRVDTNVTPRGTIGESMIVVVHDRMQSGYSYLRVAPEGEDFGPGFIPELTPREML